MTRTRSSLFWLVSLVCALPSFGQRPAPGMRLYAPNQGPDTFLVDVTGNTVHTWPGSSEPGLAVYLEEDGTLIRTGKVSGALLPGGFGGKVQRIAFDGTLLWDYDHAAPEHWAHHDIETLPNGNVLLIAWDRLTRAGAIAAGRDPALIVGTDWLPDSIVEVEQTGSTTGDIVWEWHVMDHVIQDFDDTKPNFGVVADHPELLDINFPAIPLLNGDWNHCNAIDYDAHRDLILLNSPFQGEYYVIDHSTTTVEAAGHTGGTYRKGGDLLYRWGNPAAYRAGTTADQKLFYQHGSYFIPRGFPGEGHVLVFNNRAGTPTGQAYSTVVEVEVPDDFRLEPGAAYGPDEFFWEYRASPLTSFYSRGLSNAERLPNGNTLICSGRQSRLFEVSSEGELVWEYFNTLPSSGVAVFRVSYYERSLWSDQPSLSAASGGTVAFDLVAGTRHAGRPYLLLGSASGTRPGREINGIILPLNVDWYTRALLTAVGGPALPGFAGVLDGLGRASASLTLPAIPALAGLSLHHAFAIVASSGGSVVFASNPVPLVLID